MHLPPVDVKSGCSPFFLVKYDVLGLMNRVQFIEILSLLLET